MNRAQRRAEMKLHKGQNIFLEKGQETVDRSAFKYCWLHKLKLDDINHPTERDKKLIESIKLKPVKSFDKFGKPQLARTCGRCGNTVIIPDALQLASKGSILEV